MQQFIQHIQAIAKSANVDIPEEGIAQIEKYLKGQLEFPAVEPFLFKYNKKGDRQPIEPIAKLYRDGKVSDEALARFFKLLYNIGGSYYFLKDFVYETDSTEEKAYLAFDLDHGELLKFYCTNKAFLPNPYCNCYFEPNPLGQKLDAVYEKDPGIIQQYGTQQGRLIEYIYFPKYTDWDKRSQAPQYKNIAGFSYYKIAAYLYSKEPSEELKSALIADAAKQIVLAMKGFGSETEKALRTIADSNNEVAGILKEAFESLKGTKIEPYNKKIADDFSGSKQVLDDFFMGIALAGFKIDELNSLLFVLASLDDILKRFLDQAVIETMGYLLAALDNQEKGGEDLIKYINLLAAKSNMPKQYIVAYLVNGGFALEKIRETLNSDVDVFTKTYSMLDDFRKAYLGRVMWDEGKCLEYVQQSESDLLKYIESEVENAQPLVDWLQSGGKGAVPKMKLIELKDSWTFCGIAASIKGFSSLTDLLTRFIIETSQKRILDKFVSYLKFFCGFESADVWNYFEQCSDNIEHIGALIPKPKEVNAEAEAAKKAKEEQKKTEEEQKEEEKKALAQKKAEDNARFITENGYLYHGGHQMTKKQIKKAEEIYPLLDAQLEKLKTNNKTLSSFLIWHDPDAEFGGNIFGYEATAQGTSVGSLFESLYVGIHDSSSDTILEYVLMNLLKDGKFKGIPSAYPFSVFVDLEDHYTDHVFTIYDERGLTPNPEEIKKHFEMK